MYKDKNDPRSAEAKRRWYEANKPKHLEGGKRRKEALRQKVRDLKNAPCHDCGVAYPHYVMQFDHVGDDKVINVADAVAAGLSWDRIQAEIAKCELVCSNCHAERTWNRRDLLR